MAPKSSSSAASAANHSQDSERQPLLGPASAASDYSAIPHESAPPAPRSRGSPYLTLFLRFYFAVGVLLLLPVTILLILLIINLFEPIPLLLPPHRSPAVLPLWFGLISVSMLGPGLLFFELATHATNVFHLFVLCCTVLDVVLLLAVPEFRITHSYLGFTSVGLCFLSTLWAFLSSHHLQKTRIPFTINPDVGAPIVTEVPLARAQAKWKRRFKLIWAVLGCLAVALASALVTFDLVLDAADSGFRPLGNLTMVHPTSLTKQTVYPQDPADVNPYPVSFRLHLACESAPARSGTSKSPNSSTIAPTALVMSERGVSGVVAAQFLREMVARSNSNLGGGDDDGHLALTRVCFWDRIGYGHSDFVYQPTSVRLQTEALYHALRKHDQIDLDTASKRSTLKKKKGDGESLGKFMLVSTGYGNLFAHDFAVEHPELVHSFLHIDAETPASWYTNVVSRDSEARAGYLAKRHGPFGSLFYDLLPALAEPTGITRIIGMLKGKTVVDRILAPGQRARAARQHDMGGGGWRIYGAGGANPRLLMSSWLERLDANLGTFSPNYARLSKSTSDYQSLLTKRPVAVLSSFWRIHADVDGWGEQQRESLVAPAKNSSTLIGWWRVGDRKKRSGGGDEGGPAGICSTKMGVIFCEEAVRKLIAAGQMWNSTAV
ncbi:potential vacuolar protein [Pseudozyma hubeiensis SY62]|uniref:Potential vacuolar protein n=1 Tax=Pseudozyma hubeiensis (strain SY62) TaxID=1305764 RepID=R9NZX6_PSEHS|nr:potential vacuolar protein [Pseudozyma hubeiensis SY62]GAC94292.1 potential vacuolar protein [Pseudozyma hubeiensis SY62]